MKFTLFTSMAGLMLLNSISYAGGLDGTGVPPNLAVYGGGSVGLAGQDAACGDTLSSVYSCDDKNTGYKVFAGAKLEPKLTSVALPALGVEAGYIDFGESKADGEMLSERGFSKGTATNKTSISGTYLAGVGYMHVSPKTDIIGKAGAIMWKQDSERTVPADKTLNSKTSDDGVGLLLGAGVEHKLTENFAVRGEYERALKVGKNTANETDADLYSVGAVFSSY